MASGPITSWEIDGKTVKTVWDFIFLCSKITVDGDCSHEIKRCLLLEGKLWPTWIAYLKADITLLTKVWLVKDIVFPVVMYELIGKDPDAGKDWGQEKGMTVDEMAGWHHRLDGHGFGYSGSWWWTGRPGVLWFMGSQRVRHDWVTELKWTELNWS